MPTKTNRHPDEKTKKSDAKATGKSNLSRRRRKMAKSFSIHKGMGRYILRLLNGKRKISSSLVKVLSSLISNQVENLYYECASLEKKVHKHTLRSKTVEFAIDLLYMGKFAEEMKQTAVKSANTYNRNTVGSQ